MTAVIVEHRIAETRITVWDVLHYLENDWSRQDIANALKLTEEEVQAAIAYLEENYEEVMAVHRRIEERNASGNRPEIETMLSASRAKRKAWMQERERAKKRERDGARDTGGQ